MRGMMAPFFAVMGVFFVIPLLLVVIYSFLKSGVYGGIAWELSWEGYTQLIFEHDFDGNQVFNPDYLVTLIRSVKLAGICTLFCLLAGFPIAYHMATLPEKRRNLWILLITIPFWTNLLIRTYAWILMLRTDGLINRLLLKTGLIHEPLSLLYNELAIGIGLVYSYLPFMILPLYATLERMDWQLLDAASDLYAGRWRRLLHITLPLARPGIIAGCVLVFIPAVGSFLASDLLGGGKQLMLGNLIQMQFGFSRNWPYGAAASVVLMLIVMAGTIIITKKAREAAA